MTKLMFGLVALTELCFARGDLNAANWKDRAAAFQAVAKGPITPQDQQRIIALLEKEIRSSRMRFPRLTGDGECPPRLAKTIPSTTRQF
jgi:hypothetical protein